MLFSLVGTWKQITAQGYPGFQLTRWAFYLVGQNVPTN
jgi:hypothetical protein